MIRGGGSVKPARREIYGRFYRWTIRRHAKEGKQQKNCRNDPKSAEHSGKNRATGRSHFFRAKSRCAHVGPTLPALGTLASSMDVYPLKSASCVPFKGTAFVCHENTRVGLSNKGNFGGQHRDAGACRRSGERDILLFVKYALKGRP